MSLRQWCGVLFGALLLVGICVKEVDSGQALIFYKVGTFKGSLEEIRIHQLMCWDK